MAEPQVGKFWCVRTLDGRTGAVQVDSVSVEQAPKRIVLNCVLWA